MDWKRLVLIIGAGLAVGVGVALYNRRGTAVTKGDGGSRELSSREPGVLVIGDSIAAARNSFADQLGADKLAGVGWTTRRMLEAVRQANLGNYGVVVVEGHVNDREATAEWTKANLREIFRMARDAGARVVAVGITPWAGYRTWTPAAGMNRLEVERWLRSGADGLIDQHVNLYAVMGQPGQPDRLDPGLDSGDHLHPNSSGQGTIASLLGAALRRLQ